MFFRAMRRRAPGFSLIELMVVLAIIGILTTVVTVNVFKARKQASIKAAEMSIKGIKQNLELYFDKKREYPRALDDLKKEDIIDAGEKLEDPWGIRFYYVPRFTEDGEKVVGYEVFSSGPDRVKDTPDDIGNPKFSKEGEGTKDRDR